MNLTGWMILIAVFVLVLALFAGLVWLFVLLSRGRMQPRQAPQTPPAEGPSGKGLSGKGKRPHR